MAIFSSSKRKKESISTVAASGAPPPPPHVNLSSSVNSATPLAAQDQQSQFGGTRSTSGPALSSFPPPAPPAQLSSSTSSLPTPSAPSQTVLYPWAQRRLTLLPSSLLAPPNAPPLWGPPSAPPFPRYGHSVNPVASSPSGDLYIFGGLVANTVRNDLYVLGCSPGGAGGTGTGAQGPNGTLSVGVVETRGEVPGPRVGHASVGVGNVLIVWGGDTKSRPEERQDDGLYLLNLSTREWTRVKTIGPNPEGRYGHAAAMVGSKFFVFGGQKDDGGFMNDLVWFDLQKLKAGTPKWTFIDYPAGAVAPPKRTGHTTVTHGDCIYVFGGTDGQYHYNDTWCYDTNTQIWAELSCIGYIPVPREGHAATLVDDVMYVFGGRGVDGKDLEDLAAFKITNQRWFMFQNMGPAPSGRSGHAMATWQNKVYVLGGESYTSQRSDDPAFVHVLDTSKIKYPADTSRPAQQQVARKSSIPVMANSLQGPPPSTGLPPQVAIHGPSGTPPQGNSEFRSIPEERERAASPPTALRKVSNGIPPPSAPKSFGQVVTPASNGAPKSVLPVVGQQSTSKIAKRSTTGAASPTPGAPMRPARPGDEPISPVGSDPAGFRRTMDPSNAARLEDSSVPQTAQLARTISPSLTSPTSATTNRSKGTSPPLSNSVHLPPGAGPSRLVNARSPSPLQSPQLQQQRSGSSSEGGEGEPTNGVPPEDAFYYGARAATNGGSPTLVNVEVLRSKDDEINALKAREAWMKTALALATKRGFVVGEEPAGEEKSTSLPTLEEGPNRQVVEALMQLKQELAQAKMSMAEQARSVDERMAGAARSRMAALQEASYYRAKLAALESGSVGEASKLDRERGQELEKKFADALASKAALDRRVEQLEAEIEKHSDSQSSADERQTAAIVRAYAAEGSYARSLADYADLQRRAHAHESTIQDQFERVASLTSTNQQLVAETAHLKGRVEASEASLTQYLRTLEQTQLALAAANVRNDEVHSVWQQAQTELAEHQTRTQQLQAELDAKNLETQSVSSRAVDLERVLKVTRDEHEATKILAAGGLAELVAAHRETQSRAISSSDFETERVKAIEEEAETMQRMYQEARAKSEATVLELDGVRSREVQLQTQVVQLRAEISTLRAQHAQALEEAGRHKSTVGDRDLEVREVGRAREAAEVKASLLRNLMSDHGLSVNDDELAARFPPMTGSETPEQLHRRVQDIEGRLEQRNRAHQQLETSHEDARRELHDVSRRHQAAEDQLRHLNGEISGGGERAVRAEEELEALQGRHRQLEGTHMKAVQYVKGTEKMLRRMKEELTRYKERNEELENQVAAHGERALPQDQQAELESLRLQMHDLSATSAKASTENAELQRRMSALQSDYERRLQEEKDESASQLRELETQLDGLDKELEKVQHDLEETLAVNNSLNQELTSALKSPTTSTRSMGVDNSELQRLEQELTLAQNKAEWVQRENAQLEERCLAAEQKVSILLDHMEETAGDNTTYEGSSDTHGGANFETQPPHNWKHESGISVSTSDAGSEYSQTDRVAALR